MDGKVCEPAYLISQGRRHPGLSGRELVRKKWVEHKQILF